MAWGALVRSRFVIKDKIQGKAARLARGAGHPACWVWEHEGPRGVAARGQCWHAERCRMPHSQHLGREKEQFWFLSTWFKSCFKKSNAGTLLPITSRSCSASEGLSDQPRGG